LDYDVFLEAISCYPLYLFLAKEARKRMPLLSGLGFTVFRKNIVFKQLILAKNIQKFKNHFKTGVSTC